MSNKARNTLGKFAAKSETPRKIRSVNLTDDAWQWLADVATKAGVSRNDYLEALAEGEPLMGTVNPQASPLMETVNPQASPLMETVNPQTSPLIETVNPQTSPLIETGRTNNTKIGKCHYNNILPLIETVGSDLESLRQELEEVKADRAKLLESSITIKSNLERQVRELRSQLERERASLEEVEAELSDLRQKSVPAVAEFPESADLLNQLKARRKKSRADLGDMEAVLEILSYSEE